jgi:hypothetical protein
MHLYAGLRVKNILVLIPATNWTRARKNTKWRKLNIFMSFSSFYLSETDHLSLKGPCHKMVLLLLLLFNNYVSRLDYTASNEG